MNPAEDIKDVFDGGGIRPSTWLHLVCYAGLIGLVLLLGKSLSDARAAISHAEGVSEGADRARKEANAEWSGKVKQLESDLKTVKDLKSAVRVETKYQPLIVPAAEVQRSEIAASIPLPDSPSFTVRSEAQEMEVGKLAVNFEVCKADFAKCEVNRKQAETEREEWKKVAKGGSKLRRFGSALKWIGIGVGIGLGLSR